VPQVARAPLVPTSAPYRFALTLGDCQLGRVKARDVPGRRVVAEWRSDPDALVRPYRWFRHDRVLAETNVAIALCLFERNR